MVATGSGGSRPRISGSPLLFPVLTEIYLSGVVAMITIQATSTANETTNKTTLTCITTSAQPPLIHESTASELAATHFFVCFLIPFFVILVCSLSFSARSGATS